MLQQKTCLIGGGISCALTAYILSNKLTQKQLKPTEIQIRAKDIGGRMLTKAHPNFPNLTCDIGAQYFTTQIENEATKSFYQILMENAIIREYVGQISGGMHVENLTHFVAKKGTKSVVDYFFENAKIDSIQGNVSKIEIMEDGILISDENKTDLFTSVIITIPIPDLMQIEGNIKDVLLQPKFHTLKQAQYSSRYALALFYTKEISTPFKNAMTYVKEHPIIRFISVDNQKREISHQGTSILIHTSVPFGIENAKRDTEEVKNIVLHSLQLLYPQLPHPDDVYCHWWEVSQVFKPVKDTNFDFKDEILNSEGSMVINLNPLIILCGDIFTKSGLDGCIMSAVNACEKFACVNSV